MRNQLYIPRILQDASDAVRKERQSKRKQAEVKRFHRTVSEEVNARLERAIRLIQQQCKGDDKIVRAVSSAIQRVRDEMMEEFK